MPAPSTAMRRAAAIAEHHPSELFGRNRGMLGMTKQQLHDFAATREEGLPHYVAGSPKRKGTVAGSFFGRKKRAKK